MAKLALIPRDVYLKNLTALGFKSFADKTSLDFQPGVTAIVGPNGGGKSNVSDAIRWVLGEQSAKALRGSGMVDVIFNGTDQRKALGMAEVSMTMGGIDTDQLKAAGVDLPYNEVTVTRRLFRDGGNLTGISEQLQNEVLRVGVQECRTVSYTHLTLPTTPYV